MKHYLTDADKVELKSKIIETLSEENPTGEGLNERHAQGLLRMFDEYYASKNTFTDSIREAQKPRIWKVMFRREWVQCLHVLYEIGKPLTTVEIAHELYKRGVDPFVARDATRHFVEARHWQMVEQTEDRVGNAYRYRLTSFGMNAIRKPHATLIKRFLYTMKGKVTPTPDGKEAPDIVSFGGVFYVEKRTKEEHVRDSASLDQQNNPAAFL